MIPTNGKEKLFISLNAAFLAIFYTLLGVFISYILYYLFDEYDEKWEKRSINYKLLDVSVEISLISIIAFWSSQLIIIICHCFNIDYFKRIIGRSKKG